MEAYWNKLSLDKPPTTTWLCATKDFDSERFLKVVRKIRNDLETQTFLGTEAALLSRLIYRMKSKFRNDKGLKYMEKVNRALLNYLKLSLGNEYKYLDDNTECDGNFLLLPSRQMLRYVLTRTQGFAKLMHRIADMAERAGDSFKSRMNLGHAWSISLVAYAVVGRIWLLSRHLVKKSCVWYNAMYEYHDKLKMVGVSWLPDNYRLPEDLKTWLDVSWINEEDRISDKMRFSDGIFSLISRRTETLMDLELNGEENEGAPIHSPIDKLMEIGSAASKLATTDVKIDQQLFLPVDIGKRIARDEFAAKLSEKSAQPEKCKIVTKIESAKGVVANRSSTETKIMKRRNAEANISVDRISTKEDVIKFSNLEFYPGVDKLRWKLMKKNVKKLLIKLNESERSLSAKKQEILLKKVIRSIREWMNE